MEARELHRSLFREPDETLERPDAWSDPKGFLIGGWGGKTRRELAQQYYDAATVLVEAIQSHEWEDFRLTHPVLFLYRHSIELLLKDVLSDESNRHDIRSLTSRLEVLVRERYGHELPNWVRERLLELADIDPSSTAFRYDQVYDKREKKFVPVAGEIHAGLNQLQLVMKSLHHVLLTILYGHEPKWSEFGWYR